MNPQTLTPAQIENFLTRGFVKLEAAVPRATALQMAERAWQRIEPERADVSTWAPSRHHLLYENAFLVREHAPDVIQAAADLGGPDLDNPDWDWGDGLIFNLGDDSGEAWVTPRDWDKGWHKDGGFFRHFLDSPEQALLTVVLWTDIEPQGGGTFLACDSVPIVARFLADNPQGVVPKDFPFLQLKKQCHDFLEVTGRAGDVFLLHPFLLHTASRNWTRAHRIISNPGASLKAPMNFNRENPAEQTLVGRAILNGLGTEKYDFAPTAPREKVVTKRMIEQRKLEAEKAATLANAA